MKLNRTRDIPLPFRKVPNINLLHLYLSRRQGGWVEGREGGGGSIPPLMQRSLYIDAIDVKISNFAVMRNYFITHPLLR